MKGISKTIRHLPIVIHLHQTMVYQHQGAGANPQNKSGKIECSIRVAGSKYLHTNDFLLHNVKKNLSRVTQATLWKNDASHPSIFFIVILICKENQLTEQIVKTLTKRAVIHS